jgi:hypothetical protein
MIDMSRRTTIKLAIAGSTGLLMVAIVVIVGLRKSRVGFEGDFLLTLIIALLPSAIFAVTGPVQPRVLRWGTIHALLLGSLALLYLIGTGPYGFIYAALLSFAALVTSIVATVDR